MESWDEWETEIQERLAELTNEHSSPDPEREHRWVSIGSAGVLTTEGVAREARMDPPRAPDLDISNLREQPENPSDLERTTGFEAATSTWAR
jgi:hypothetical protein